MESAESVYYTDNSEIIEEDSTWNMEDVVIVDNDNVNWQDEGEITINYDDTSENPEQTLTENEIYMSTDADDVNEADKTEYFSILETTYQGEDDFEENVSANIVVNVNEEEKMILPHSYNNDYVAEEVKENTDEENLDNQVILYSSDDPNEMYAVQIADDGNGNFQRYKYKVRTNADGQLEAIPGTIEIQDASVDDIIQKTIADSDNICAEEENVNEEHVTQENFTSNTSAIKHEAINENSLDASDLEDEYGTPEYLLSENESEEEVFNHEQPKESNLELQIQNDYLEITPDIQEDDDSIITINDKVNEKKRKFFKTREGNLSLNTNYNIKNNKHDNEIIVYKGDKKLSYLLIDTVEKENVELTEVHNLAALGKNNRSILKTSFLVPVEDNKKSNKTTIRMLNNNKEVAKGIKDKPEGITVENKIADKSVRQPRKQTIRPVERFGSEIIVQPVYYTVNEEPVNNSEFIPKKKKLPQTSIDEVVPVSDDSDPDYTEHPKPKKRKTPGRKSLKNRKIAHITISDSEHSTDDECVVEVLEEAMEDTDNENQSDDDCTTIDLDKSDDITKIQEAVDNIVQEREERNKAEKLTEENKNTNLENGKNANTNKEIVKKNNVKCKICPKTFPREINLKTHMNIHNRRSLRRKSTEKTNAKPEQKSTSDPKKLDKFYCSKCKLKFLSEMQLKRHAIVHKERKIVPGITPKKLQILRKSTMSPLKLRRSIKKLPDRIKLTLAAKNIDTKNVVTSPRRPFKCDQCPQSFSQRTLLSTHKLNHKQFSCTKCNIRFTTKSLLDDHLKKKCNRIDSLKPKSIARSPIKTKSRISQVFHSCVSCRQRFRTLELLSEHKIKEHKKQLPAKTLPSKSVTTRSKHGGVPTSARMQRAFDLMKLKS